jgi:DUF971 family protein
MLTLDDFYNLAFKKLSIRKNVFDISQSLPAGGIENWVQWELIEALKDAGHRTELKGKVEKGCDIIVNNERYVELRTASNGYIGNLKNAIEKHPNANLYLFTYLNREGSDAKTLFESYLETSGFVYKSGSLTPSMVMTVAERLAEGKIKFNFTS